MTKRHFRVLLFIIILILLGIFMWLFGSNYQVKIKEYGDHGIVKCTNDKQSFIKSFIKGYNKTINSEVDEHFYKNFPLYSNVSARFYISNYDESIVYIYPSDKKLLMIDYLDKPAQLLLSHGLIDINNPEADLHPEKLLVNASREDAVSLYQKAKSNIMAGGGQERDSAYFGGGGDLRLNNFFKIIEFVSPETMMTLGSGKLIISSSDPITKSIYGRDMEFNYPLTGPLIISNIVNFENDNDIGEKIGTRIAEMHIKQLIVKSAAFKFFIDDKKLRPFAEPIAEKSKMSESNPALYPHWKFTEDIRQMYAYAEKEGISKGYADELKDMLKAGAMTGTLLTYYKNGHEFVIQWLLINAIVLVCMSLLVLIGTGNSVLLINLMTHMKQINADKYLLSVIVVAVNAWVFTAKPAHLDIRFWILPGISFFTNLCVSGYIQKYIVK